MVFHTHGAKHRVTACPDHRVPEWCRACVEAQGGGVIISASLYGPCYTGV